MRVKTIFKVLAIVVFILFLLAVIGIGALFEMYTFRASLSGRITDTEGNPIAGAKVEFYKPDSDSIKHNYSTKTNPDGRYWMNLPPFRAALDLSPDYRRTVRISADGYATVSTYQRLKKDTIKTAIMYYNRCPATFLRDQLGIINSVLHMKRSYLKTHRLSV